MGRYTVSNAHQSEQQVVTLAVHPLRWVLNGEDLNSSTPLPSTASTTGMMGLRDNERRNRLRECAATLPQAVLPPGAVTQTGNRGQQTYAVCSAPGLHAVT